MSNKFLRLKTPKPVPVEEEDAYITQVHLLKLEKERLDKLKDKLLAYNTAGRSFSKLTVVAATERFSPPWQDILKEVLEKYEPKKSIRVRFLNNLRKRFPPTPVSASFRIPKDSEEEE